MGYVVAAEEDDDGIGLTVGLEFGVENVNEGNGGSKDPYLSPMLIYEKSFLDGALDLYAELDYFFYFNKVGGDFRQELYFDLSLGYNLSLGNASTLSFILENEFDRFIIAPSPSGSNSITGIFTPAVKFNQEFDFGDLYAQLGAPITYMQYEKNADLGVGLDLTLGWASTFGLGIELIEHNSITPDAGYTGLDLIISYETGPIYFEVEIDTYKDMDAGITIIPDFEYSFKAFTFYANCTFDYVGSKGDIEISPAIGVKFSF
jgi:hypothetical protein